MFKESLEDTAIAITEDFIFMNERIYVPLFLRKEIYSQNYDPQTVGHLGIDYTLERIQRIYYFLKIRKYVEDRIRKCTTC
jgi:Integrase zinc binding domain